jgi:hypothetical protein
MVKYVLALYGLNCEFVLFLGLYLRTSIVILIPRYLRGISGRHENDLSRSGFFVENGSRARNLENPRI